MRQRSRKTFHVNWKAGEFYYPRQPNAPKTPLNIVQNGVVYTDDSCADDLAPGPPYRKVNGLMITKTKNQYCSDPYDFGEHWYSGTGGSIYEQRYRGYYYVSQGVQTPALYGSASSYNSMSLDALGATGWSKFKPAKPIADVGVMLGESRELPRQFKELVKDLKRLRFHPSKTVRNMSFWSNQHLAVQFGWLPLMHDLEKCYNAITRSDSWLKRVRKYNGQWEHRGGTVAQGSGQHIAGSASLLPSPSGYSTPPEGLTPGTIYVTWGYRVWFSAWFKYYIRDFASLGTQARLRARIWGLTNTPTIVWNLLPWSWLVDWFSNLGDNIDNLVPIDGLVAKMPCVMRHCWTNYFVRASQRYKEPNGSFITHTGTNTKEVVTKSRGIASPFGFGLTWDEFTPRQLSILAALGVQRSGS